MKSLSNLSQNKEQFPALTGIRAIAAFMVFFHHLPFYIQPDAFIGLQLTFYTGVNLFFVLSGFLITYRYYGKIELSGRYVWNYFINRFARIYPLYFLLLTVVIICQKNFDPVFLLQNYTLTHNLSFLFPSHGMAIVPSWSLTVEECFYLLAPLIFFLCRKYNLAIPILLLLLLFVLILVAYNGPLPFYRLLRSMLQASFFGYLISFFAGIYVALLVLRKKENDFLIRNWAAYGVVGMAVLSLPLICITNKGESIRPFVMFLFNNFLLPFPIAMFYYGLIYNDTWLKRFLSGFMMRLFGRSSYAFYLLHIPFIQLVATPFIKPHFGSTYYNLYVIVIFILVLILSLALFILYEEPMNFLIRKKMWNTQKPSANR